MTTANDVIAIGTGCSICVGSDRYPATVVAVKGKRVGVQYDDYHCVSGSAHNGSGVYEYTQNTNGAIVWFSKRKNGVYRRVKGSTPLWIGRREYYYDPHI